MDRRRLPREATSDTRLDRECVRGFEVVEQYVELELAGRDPASPFGAFAAHLRSCPSCRELHDGVIAAARNERERRLGL